MCHGTVFSFLVCPFVAEANFSRRPLTMNQLSIVLFFSIVTKAIDSRKVSLDLEPRWDFSPKTAVNTGRRDKTRCNKTRTRRTLAVWTASSLITLLRPSNGRHRRRQTTAGCGADCDVLAEVAMWPIEGPATQSTWSLGSRFIASPSRPQWDNKESSRKINTNRPRAAQLPRPTDDDQKQDDDEDRARAKGRRSHRAPPPSPATDLAGRKKGRKEGRSQKGISKGPKESKWAR